MTSLGPMSYSLTVQRGRVYHTLCIFGTLLDEAIATAVRPRMNSARDYGKIGLYGV